MDRAGDRGILREPPGDRDPLTPAFANLTQSSSIRQAVITTRRPPTARLLPDRGPNNGLWLVNVQSGRTEQLHEGPGVFESVFAPDGSALFVAGGESLITRLPFNADTGALRGPPEVIPVPGVPGVRGLTISRDGRVLGFAGLSLDSQIWKQPVGASGASAGATRCRWFRRRAAACACSRASGARPGCAAGHRMGVV